MQSAYYQSWNIYICDVSFLKIFFMPSSKKIIIKFYLIF